MTTAKQPAFYKNRSMGLAQTEAEAKALFFKHIYNRNTAMPSTAPQDLRPAPEDYCLALLDEIESLGKPVKGINVRTDEHGYFHIEWATIKKGRQ